MNEYVTPEEAAARWSNLQSFFAARGHFWLGTGAFYLDAVYPVEGSVVVKCSGFFTDPSDKWAIFTAPKLAVVDVEGPDQVTVGAEATFDVFVTYEGAAYPAAEVGAVKFLLYDAAGELVSKGDAVLVADGQYQVVLPADVTGLLAVGSGKLEVAVTSIVVSIPSFAAFEFLTAAP
jgi:peptide/nickel transport system substrate-binding protein